MKRIKLDRSQLTIAATQEKLNVLCCLSLDCCASHNKRVLHKLKKQTGTLD